MNGYYGETASTIPNGPCEVARPDPIPAVIEKANACLAESMEYMVRIFKLLFGDQPDIKEIPKCENLTQGVQATAIRADEILCAMRIMMERLGT